MDIQSQALAEAASTADAPQRLRTSKACEECRKRKIRCTGQSPTPCDYCRQKRLHCVYRSQARIRRPRHVLMGVARTSAAAAASASAAAATAAATAMGDGGEAAAGIGGSPLENSLYAGVSATYADSPSRTLQLYYGPSSNFPMIQHIHQRLNAAKSSAAATAPSAIEEVDEGLDRFNYRGIFFGKHSDQQDMSYPSAGGGLGGGGGGGGGARRKTVDDSNLLFLPYHLAADFLEKFLTSLQRHLPFVEPAAVTDSLSVLYGSAGAGDAREMDIGERAILMAILAIGATLTEHAVWAETLYKRAKALADELDDVVNVHVCQLGLLLAHYQCVTGKPNSVYLLVGTAMRKAVAAGLHKEALSKERQSVDFALVQERRLTFWSIYIFEVTISLGLGRPISIHDSDIGIPYPEDSPFVVSLITLARVYSRASQQLYGTKQGSLLSLYRTAAALKAELDDFRASLTPELKLGPDASFGPGAPGALKFFLNNWYYHAVILIFRPFLIFHAQWQADPSRRLTTDPAVAVSKRQLRASAPWIFTACDACVSAARELLICLHRSMETNDLVRRLAYSCFYVEGGAFLLIFNMLRERRTAGAPDSGEDARCVRLALEAMEMMYDTTPRNISLFAIRRMLALVEGVENDDTEPWDGTSPENSATPGMALAEPAVAKAPLPIPGIAGVPPRGAVQPGDVLDWDLGEMKLNFDLNSMDLDCWLAMEGFGGVGACNLG